MTVRVCRAGRVTDGGRILDVGCGFGGTIDYLSDRLRDCTLVGVNIDGRQLVRASRSVPRSHRNTVHFVQADGGLLPFVKHSFDVILAVECIFHLDSRKAFFREMGRLLKPGGTLALTDFVLREGALLDLGQWMAANAKEQSRFYGPSNNVAPTSSGYSRLARSSGLEVLCDIDITANTLPTYGAMRRLYGEAGIPEGGVATDYLDAMARKGFLEYHILAFSPPEAAPGRVD
jgi:SAM-dependent methyltransferase